MSKKNDNAQTYITGYIRIDYEPIDDYFAIGIYDADLIKLGFDLNTIFIVRKQNFAYNGDLIFALLNDEQTYGFYRLNNNKAYLFFKNKDLFPIPITENDELLILGKIIETRTFY